MSLEWQNGRQLAGVTGDGLNVSYKYNSAGIRTEKTVNGITTKYTLQDKKVVRESDGTNTLWYFYDDNDSVVGFELNGTTYYYVKNLHDDVLGILDADGVLVVSYTYDSWGRQINCTGPMASTVGEVNPYRYRSYRYDSEIGLYYLNSRYYDPSTGRFINADNASIIDGANAHMLENNLYAYCFNNPINSQDDEGTWPNWLKKVVAAVAVVVVVAVVAAVVVATAGAGTAAAAVAIGAAKGAAIGAASGAALGAAGGAISHRIQTGSWEGAGQAALEGMGDGALSGAITGGITGGANGYSAFKAGGNSSGVPFNPKGSSQTGVDPNTLNYGRSLNPDKLSAVRKIVSRSGMYGVIQVSRSGTIIDGNHRVAIARLFKIAVDVIIR